MYRWPDMFVGGGKWEGWWVLGMWSNQTGCVGDPRVFFETGFTGANCALVHDRIANRLQSRMPLTHL